MKNYDVKKMYEWPLAAQLLVIVICAALLLYLGYFFDILSLQNQIVNGSDMEQDLKQQLEISYNQQVSVINDITQLPALQKTLKQLQTKLIDQSELQSLQDIILKYGDSDQLKVNSFIPDTEVKVGKFVKIPVAISMTGTYDEIATFISQIANMPNLISIDDFTISKQDLQKETTNANTLPNQNSNNTDTSTSSTSGAVNSDALLNANLIIEIYRK